MIDWIGRGLQTLLITTAGAYLGVFMKGQVDKVNRKRQDVLEPLYNEVAEVSNFEHNYAVVEVLDGDSVWEDIEPSVRMRLSDEFEKMADNYTSRIEVIQDYWDEPQLHAAEILAKEEFSEDFESYFPDLIRTDIADRYPGPAVVFDSSKQSAILNGEQKEATAYENKSFFLWLFEITDVIRESEGEDEFRERVIENGNVNPTYWDEVHPGWEAEMWNLLKHLGSDRVEEGEESGWLRVKKEVDLAAKARMLQSFQELVQISGELEDKIRERLQRSPYNPRSW